MPRYHYSGPQAPEDESHRRGNARAPKRRRASSSRRFGFPSLPVLDPRVLTSTRTAETQPTRRRPTRTKTFRQRLQQRTWNASHIIGIILLAAALAGLALCFQQDAFYVYAADIADAQYTSAEQIFEQAGIDGLSIFFADPTAIEQQLARLPYIRSATAQVRLPGGVSIQVRERQPSIVYEVSGQRYWSDDEGFIAPSLEERADLVKLIDDEAGARIAENHIDLALLRAVQQISLNLPQVRTFHFQQPYGLYFISPEGWRVYLGSAESMPAKLATWEAVRRQILAQKSAVQEVDLRFKTPYWH